MIRVGGTGNHLQLHHAIERVGKEAATFHPVAEDDGFACVSSRNDHLRWAVVTTKVYTPEPRARAIMYLHHKVVEFLLGEMLILMVGPRVLATHAPVFDATPIITIADIHVGGGARRAQQVDHQFGGVDGGGPLQGYRKDGSSQIRANMGEGSSGFFYTRTPGAPTSRRPCI